MTSSDEDVLARYSRRGILIDTNILLLLLIGLFDRRLIGQFKRTRIFATEDFDLLCRILSRFERRVTTPHILTEVSNLAGQLPDAHRSACFKMLSRLIGQMPEHYLASSEIATVGVFERFGLTDCGIEQVAVGAYLVLTDDFKLASHLQTIGVDVINFNHIRLHNWQ